MGMKKMEEVDPQKPKPPAGIPDVGIQFPGGIRQKCLKYHDDSRFFILRGTPLWGFLGPNF